MNDSPIIKLQHMAATRSSDIEDLLSRAHLISAKLGLSSMTEWFDHEINGYPETAKLPTYRILKDIPIYGLNPLRGYVPLDLDFILKKEPSIHEEITTLEFINPISMMAEYAKSQSTLYCALPPHHAGFLKDLFQCRFQLFWSINPILIVSLVAAIRKKVKDWALMLENNGIYGEGLIFSPEEKKEAQSVTYNNTINNNGNGLTVLGNVESTNSVVGGTVSHVQQQNITGDFSTLERQLKEHGIDEADINELKEVVDQTPKPQTKEDVEKGFGAWIGKMTGKAFTGAIKIAGSAAPVLLTNYICHHYGIPV